MQKIPQQIETAYNALLFKKGLPKRHHVFYRKWLRYYLDFCLKYGFDRSKKSSLSHFIEKLNSKKQTVQQQKEASRAISIYYQIELSSVKPKISTEKEERTPFSIQKGPKLKNADWRPVYDNLNSEIKIRHYSPKTLSSYRAWIRQLQAFTKSKDPKLLSSSDAKDFLTFLAVKRKVSASSQNQAFNALLFFFRHILRTELGDLKDVPRAKRKPYIRSFCRVRKSAKLLPSFHTLIAWSLKCSMVVDFACLSA